MQNDVRLNAWQIGPKGGRKKVASQIVSRENAQERRYEWEYELNDDPSMQFEVTIQDGNIRARV